MQRQLLPENVDTAFFIHSWQHLSVPAEVIVCCVASRQTWQACEQACLQLWGLKAERVDVSEQCAGVVNAYSKIDELGVDRWCAMIGAHHLASTAVMVADCGSAITVDIVAADGQHKGGYIIPGIRSMKVALQHSTAAVKADNENEIPALLPGHSTAACVESGVNLAIIALLERIFQQQQIRYPELCCMLTGGDAELVSAELSIRHQLQAELVLTGLQQLAAAR